MNKLEQLMQMTTIVADTGEIDSIESYQPRDTTTNPSLLYKAAQLPQYHQLVMSACSEASSHTKDSNLQQELVLDYLAVNFGAEILKIIPGRISTEVDARLSFDTQGTIERANRIIKLYQDSGIEKDRVLIKIASTWEGIQAAKVLEQDGIHCNLTLLFSFYQAVACAEAGVTLVSPFVGRILDWYKKTECVTGYAPLEDPGVKSVTRIYHYFKKHGYKTQVMGASFRNTDEILSLAGCDLLTISPQLMEELRNSTGDVPRQLNAVDSHQLGDDKIVLDEKSFRWSMNEEIMASEKLAEGIRGFTSDTLKLASLIEDMKL